MRRFEEKYVKVPSGCWEWTASTSHNGYGFFLYKGKMHMAHRASYDMHIGPIPEGKLVLHRCDNPPCVNPDHLFLGTYADNSDDKVAKGRHPAGETHGRAKLTAEDVRTIRAEYTVQYDPKRSRRVSNGHDLARRYGMSLRQIMNVVHGEQWKTLE